jgi:hypothetical protein
MAERGRFANLSKTRASAALNEVLTYEGSSRRETLVIRPPEWVCVCLLVERSPVLLLRAIGRTNADVHSGERINTK